MKSWRRRTCEEGGHRAARRKVLVAPLGEGSSAAVPCDLTHSELLMCGASVVCDPTVRREAEPEPEI